MFPCTQAPVFHLNAKCNRESLPPGTRLRYSLQQKNPQVIRRDSDVIPLLIAVGKLFHRRKVRAQSASELGSWISQHTCSGSRILKPHPPDEQQSILPLGPRKPSLDCLFTTDILRLFRLLLCHRVKERCSSEQSILIPAALCSGLMFSSNTLFHFLIFKFEATQNNYSLRLVGNPATAIRLQGFAREHLCMVVGGELLFIALR